VRPGQVYYWPRERRYFQVMKDNGPTMVWGSCIWPDDRPQDEWECPRSELQFVARSVQAFQARAAVTA
jgi:hypothetical protein